nr:uncharacterized protein LOC107450801 [Parasteatoda tepidariorum]
MYLQIEIHSEDRNFQKILWRDDPMKPVREYRLCAITHGTAPASYLATRVLKQLVIDEGLDFPKAANSVLHNFYIDDGLFGAESADEAVALKNELWKHQLAWDDPVPQDIKEKWIKYRVDISQVTLTVPRTVLLYSPSGFELYCFCDASEKAYAAVILVYLKSSTITTTQISVLTSKTRVAPLKTISIPRLDLCSAVLLVHLLQTVLKSLTFQIDAVRAFIDSTIVLAWLKSEPSRWQIFVANRVSEIQSILPVQHWNHISSGQNPADCASRGLPPNELVNFDLWWSGPQWMNSGDISHLEEISLSTDALKEESKKTSCLIETTPIDFPIIYNVSSYVKLKRIIAWCLCFIMNCKSPNNRINGYLTSSEIKLARNVLVKIVQKQEFLREYHQLKNSKPIS